MTGDGEYEAPDGIYTTNPLFIEATHLIGSKIGVLHDVVFDGGKIVTIDIEGTQFTTRHYTVTGTTSLTDLWYDEQDVLVKFIVRDGRTPVSVWLRR